MNTMPKDRKMLFGYSPDTYKERLERQREIAAMPDNEDGWSTSGSGFPQDFEIDWLQSLLAANEHLDPQDPHSPIQRNNQPMGTFMKIGWKDDDGNYTESDSFKNALNYSNGGSFKDALLAMDNSQKQDWLNNNYGGRGLGYMGQNAYPSIPMAKRKQLVQQNAKPALIRQLARMNRPKVAPYGAGLFQFGKLPWQ